MAGVPPILTNRPSKVDSAQGVEKEATITSIREGVIPSTSTKQRGSHFHAHLNPKEQLAQKTKTTGEGASHSIHGENPLSAKSAEKAYHAELRKNWEKARDALAPDVMHAALMTLGRKSART
jgi:hypothetical protein